MSVVGLDVGNDGMCVALARKRGIDVLMNKESKRETPSVVNFGDKMRFMGTDGAAKFSLAPQNTIHQLKRILGKQFDDPQLQADIAKLPFSVTRAADGGCLLNVTFLNESAVFTPEQVMAMLLVDLKKIAEAEGVSVTDCVLAVPTYYNERERYSMLNAASIAGLNCLRLLNDNTATALSYGIYKTDLPEETAVNVAFVDMGHSAIQVSIVALKKAGLVVKSHAWDRNLGGRDVDEALFDHFVAEFKAKNKIDIATNKRASFKLRAAIEKLKKTLSANSECSLAVECIMEDTDVRSNLSREQLEELCAPVFERIKAPMVKALADAGLSAADIATVEIVGSSTRLPYVAKVIEDVFGRSPSRTLNSKECVSRGCALQCAMLSPVFKVRDFGVEDAVPYTVEFSWEKDGTVVTQPLFEANTAFPTTKMLTFLRSEPFKITARVPALNETIGEYQVGPFEVPAGAEKAKLKVKVKMNLHGLIVVDGADNYVEVEEEVAPKDVAMEDAAAAAAAPAETSGAAPMDTEAAGPPAPAAEIKKKVKKMEVGVSGVVGVSGYSRKLLDDMFEKEHQLQASDRLQEETNERKNALEGYVYSLRNRMYETLAPYIADSDKAALGDTLQATEDWLYDEGEDTSKSVYVAKLDELKKIGGPIEQRMIEDQTRGPAAASMKASAESYLAFARSESPSFAHIEPVEKEMVAREAQAVLDWLAEKVALQAKLSKSAEPVLATNDITKKRATLDLVAKPIVTKPAPKKDSPKDAAPAEPEPVPASEDESTPAPMDADVAEPEEMDMTGDQRS